MLWTSDFDNLELNRVLLKSFGWTEERLFSCQTVKYFRSTKTDWEQIPAVWLRVQFFQGLITQHGRRDETPGFTWQSQVTVAENAMFKKLTYDFGRTLCRDSKYIRFHCNSETAVVSCYFRISCKAFFSGNLYLRVNGRLSFHFKNQPLQSVLPIRIF